MEFISTFSQKKRKEREKKIEHCCHTFILINLITYSVPQMNLNLKMNTSTWYWTGFLG